MHRITGGKYRSRKIHLVHDSQTRETSDFVKEATFNLLGNAINGRVLDLFAGSGAYGLESLSRGASQVYFNDLSKASYKTIQVNIQLLQEEDNSKLLNIHYQSAIKNLESQNIMFEYIFLDPPFDEFKISDLLSAVEGIILKDGFVILEISKKTEVPSKVQNYTLIKSRIYGLKRIVIYVKM